MVSETIRAEILRRLQAAEAEHEVRVLLAVESGSRAWGFASPNSDYDVRFIYAHPMDWYLAVGLEEQRDVIEYPIVDEIDINGWDLRKALRLFRKSNPAFVEWIQSPIIYRQQGAFARLAREALPLVYSRRRGIHHYLSMAKTNFRGYLKAEQVPLKKYFYVLRALLAARWLERRSAPAPIEFERLLQMIDDDDRLSRDIDVLLRRKRTEPELGLAPPIASIRAFIDREIERLQSVVIADSPTDVAIATRLLNAIFRECLREAWR